MKTYKSIAGLLAEWIVYTPKRFPDHQSAFDGGGWLRRIGPLRSLCEHRAWMGRLPTRLLVTYRLQITDHQLQITCHQLSKSPPKSTQVVPNSSKGFLAKVAVS
jgi:hypothetical protein